MKEGRSASEAKVMLESLQLDFESEPRIGKANLAMLCYAVKLTVNPQSISTDDVQELRDHGFDDLAIHDICAVTAYFAFVNRIADGLGVELENREPER